MKLIKTFQIIILLLFLSHCDLILNDYGNGNKGIGVNDEVKGKNNTWMGNSNNINGDVNKVIGNENKISGSNNIVQGNGNVIGDMSPEQILKLQNQMFANFQDRFKGVFNFDSPKPTPNQQSPTQQHSQFCSQSPSVTSKSNSETSQTTQKSIYTSTANQILQKNNSSQNEQKIQKTKDHPKQEQLDRSMLVFRSYGKQYRQLIRQQIYQLYDEVRHEQLKDVLCKRWNFCLHVNRDHRMFFSSVYPTFPYEIDS